MMQTDRKNDDTSTTSNRIPFNYDGIFSSDAEVECRHSSNTARAVLHALNCKAWMHLDSRGCKSNHS